ncbi:hypothetical protein Acr_25g0002850 [Actinidia rufa]|uniref:Uncharacterized protein n=1 Tax=Actinidia rufa TaxID=165716 RepID=A0A7J0GYJ5_9ERIC|nr:hypothetical protein Acr_25g0002850 [Actinidia rufa]
MSTRINLEDGELGHSLPSWVSDLLGGKSYITDDVNQSPSSPLKGSPMDNSSDYSEMDTSNLTKETSVMSQGDLDKLREKYSLPFGIQLRILEEGKTILSTRPGKVALYEAAFHDGKSCNKLPVLTEDEAKRTAEVLGKIEPGVYFDVSKVLDSKTFKKHFARGRMEVSSRGGEITTSGDEGESRLSRGDLQHGSPSRGDSWWLGGKVQDPFSNLFPRGSSLRSDLRSESLSDSGLSLKLRSDGKVLKNSPFILLLSWSNARFIYSYVSMDQPVHSDQKGWGEEGCELNGDISTTLERDCHSRKTSSGGRPQPHRKEGRSEDSKGKEAMLPPLPKRTKSNKGASNAVVRASGPESSSTLPGKDLGPRALMMYSASVAWKILRGAILPADKEKVNQFPTEELVIESFHALEGQLAELGEQAVKTGIELKDKFEAMARLEADVVEVTSKLALAKKLAIEKFKSSNDFKVAVTDFTATYFGEGFEFYKRQLLHQHPNLCIDVASMEMDADFAEEEAAAKEGEKEEGNKGEAKPAT